jgi:chorismate mutase
MSTIEKLRAAIEQIDTEIMEKLALRQTISKEIGLLKSKTDQQIVDIDRENQLMTFYEKLSSHYNLQPEFTKQVFKLVIQQSKKIQTASS